MHRFSCLAAGFFLPAFAALAATNIQNDGSVLLPVERNPGSSIHASKQTQLSGSPAWQAFVQAHGSWGVLWNEATSTPHRAFGSAFKITGYSSITPANIKDAAMAFITEQRDLLKVTPEDLRLIRTNDVHNRWYVTYRQVKDGIDVLFSEVELRIFSNGNVMAFGSDFYSDVEVSTTPSISYETAKTNAVTGLDLSSTKTAGNGRLWILPVTDHNGVEYHLAYEVFVTATAPVGNYVALVDAHDGTLLWRHNLLRYTDVSGTVTGTVQLTLPTDPFLEEGFREQYVTIGGVQVRTDSVGYYSRDITTSTTLTAALSGPYVNVNRADGTDASLSTTVAPGDTFDILWDDGNATPGERDGFYNVEIVHTYITTLDPNFTFINYSMPCAVNINSTCNAYWDGNGVNFFHEGDGCPNTSQMPDVVFHEYGHGINDKLYEQLGAPFGMINGATHEGMADVNASAILDDSRVGRGFFGPGSVLRNLDNSNRYPQNVSSDPHTTGLIIGGAFWDLRQATDVETFRYLNHFAKYGLPDDADDGIAFQEWFVETLVADDDDGNLGNGTPHMVEISSSFNAHGIGSELFFRNSFSHAPLPSTTDTTNDYAALFSLEGAPIIGGDPDSVQLVYSTDNFQSSIPVLATSTGPGEFEADIPAQPYGTLVKYYITAYDGLSDVWYNFPSTAPVDSVYRFMVGSVPAQAGIMYGASTASSNGSLYAIDITTGAATLIGTLGVRELQSMTVRPSTGELYGSYTLGSTTTLYKVNTHYGDALSSITTPVTNLRAIAFGENDTLYGVTSTGALYRINITTGAATFIGNTPGNMYWSLAIDPATSKLWGGVRFTDRVYTINRTNGSSTLVGQTGFSSTTASLAFDAHGNLFGITAGNAFIGINKGTGAGTLIGTPAVTGIIALAMRVDSVILSVHESQTSEIPREYGLSQNYPNPFNPSTEIRYAVPEQSLVKLTLFNMLGQEVRLLENGVQGVGYHTARWDGLNSSGAPAASGIYFFKLEAFGDSGKHFASVKRMLLLK